MARSLSAVKKDASSPRVKEGSSDAGRGWWTLTRWSSKRIIELLLIKEEAWHIWAEWKVLTGRVERRYGLITLGVEVVHVLNSFHQLPWNNSWTQTVTAVKGGEQGWAWGNEGRKPQDLHAISSRETPQLQGRGRSGGARLMGISWGSEWRPLLPTPLSVSPAPTAELIHPLTKKPRMG